jgi:hypothetical protein
MWNSALDAAALSLYVPSPSSTPAPSSSRVPIALWYPLTADASDVGGVGRHGTATGGSFGVDGYTATGPGQFISIPAVDWEVATVALSYTYHGGCDSDWHTIVWSSPGHHPLLINCGSGTLGWYNNGFADSSVVIRAGQSYALALVAVGPSWTLYVDGALVLSGQSYRLSEAPIVLLGEHGAVGGVQSMDGTLLNVRMWNSALDAAALSFFFQTTTPTSSSLMSSLASASASSFAFQTMTPTSSSSMSSTASASASFARR